MLKTTFFAVLCAAAAYGASVKIGDTTVIGLDIPTFEQEFFGGIPYAVPPLGDLRFRPPVLKTTLDGSTFNATAYGPSCLQVGFEPPLVSEDCLSVNVLRPAGLSADAGLPVMLWVYGGGFDSGGSVLYNGSGIVLESVLRGTPVIFASLNYRLGPLGFLQGKEAGDNGALNLGIRDELAAIEWIHTNIGLFGGDKDKITVFGESAGAIITSILFLNSPIADFARAAIFESGSQAASPLFLADRNEIDWQHFVANVESCSDLAKSGSTFACLRKASSAELLIGLNAAFNETEKEFPWQPLIDGPGGLIPELPSALFKKGQFTKLPFISGTNLDEGTLFTNTAVNGEANVFDIVFTNFTPSFVSEPALKTGVNKLLEMYYPDIPALGSPFGTGNDTFGLAPEFKQLAAIFGDTSFVALRREWMGAAAGAGVPTFGYLFTEPVPGNPPYLGVFHSTEIDFVYGAPPNTTSGFALSQAMMNYWISFADSLTPNDGLGVPRPAWTQWTPKDQAVIQLNGDNLTMIPDTFRIKQTDFINSNPTLWNH
ncbi:Carboxylic ester hydrolase [Mycena chlorophos]|uniref:Carboxylic ester hydrolase n=1 Tax=Mycena chlorophos TaxID=658473 RepID=A0A8H6SUZ9_MYCCL|nr:Carboxylic ester hydrolase [Mycena chlorophos]